MIGIKENDLRMLVKYCHFVVICIKDPELLISYVLLEIKFTEFLQHLDFVNIPL